MEVGIVNSNNAVNSSVQKSPVMQKVAKDNSSLQNIPKEDTNSEVTQEKLDEAVEKANKVLFKNDTHLKFEIHDVTKDVMVKIINDESGEVLKEIPPKKMLDMVAKLWEIAGILIDEKR